MGTATKPQPGEQIVRILLFVFVSSVYFATLTGITSSNDGSHYAATRALADTGRLDIAPYFSFVEGQDYALDRWGVARSDRPPGTALVASLVYRLGQVLPEPRVHVRARHDAANLHTIFAPLTSVLAGAGTVTLFYTLLRQHFGVSIAAGLLGALGLAFGTITWKYSTVLYSHALSSLLLLASLSLILRAERGGGFAWHRALVSGFLLGAATLIEYTNGVFVAIILIYLAVIRQGEMVASLRERASRQDLLRSLFPGALGLLLPVGVLVVYNTILFGGPFRFSTFQIDPELWPNNQGFSTFFSTPVLTGLIGLLLWGSGNQGLLLLSPVSILALPGLVTLYRHRARLFWLFAGTFAIVLLLFSTSATFNPATNDGRYLTPFLGLWFVPLALWLDRSYFRIERDLLQVLASLLVFGLLFISMRNVAALIALSWGYDLDLALLENRAIPPHNMKLIGETLFRNAPNLPLLWGLEAVGLGIGVGFVRVRRVLAGSGRLALDFAALAAISGFVLFPVGRALRNPVPDGMTLLDERMGDGLSLVGYQLITPDHEQTPADSVQLRLYWMREGPLSEDSTISLKLVAEDGTIWGDKETLLGTATYRHIPVATWPVGKLVQESYVVLLRDSPPYSLETDVVLATNGATLSPFRVQPATMTVISAPDEPLDFAFEGVAALTGYDIERLSYDRLAVTLYWNVTHNTSLGYTTFVHLVGPDGAIATQQDAPPFDGRYPTFAWQPGEKLIDTYILQIDPKMPAATYVLRVGLYDPENGARIVVRDGQGESVHENAPYIGEVALP